MKPTNNPNRESSIKAMIVAGLVTLILVVMYLAQLGGDDTQTAAGKTLIVVPLLLVILLASFSIYYYRDVLLSFALSAMTIKADEEPMSANQVNVLPTESLDMLRRIKELTGELDAAKREVLRLEEIWRDMFGPASEEEVKETLSNMYSELESLRITVPKEKLDELREENLTKTLVAQELAEKLRESKSSTAQALAQNKELLERLNKTTLRLDLLEAEKVQLTSRLQKQTWCEVDWEEFMKSVNFGSNLLSENSRWSTRIMQRVNAEGLVIFGDPSVSSLAAFYDLTELSAVQAPPEMDEVDEVAELTES